MDGTRLHGSNGVWLGTAAGVLRLGFNAQGGPSDMLLSPFFFFSISSPRLVAWK